MTRLRLHFLGACREVGRSGIILEADKRMLLDYGVKLSGRERTEYPVPFQGFLDAFILSHAHLDHCGNAPVIYQYSKTPFFATHPTRELAEMLLLDSMKVARLRGEKCPFNAHDVKKLMNSFVPLSYDRPFKFSPKTSITLHDAGHIAGAAITEIRTHGTKIVYTGDFKLAETRMHSGASFVEKADVLITESTYSNREHPDRKKLENELKEKIRSTIKAGGSVLFPAFAVGRSQELLMLVKEIAPSVPVFLDGMSKKATEVAAAYPSYLRSIRELREGMKNAEWVESEKQREQALENPSIIISSAGMLEGGPALSYLARLNEDSRIVLTGYQVEGTNARRLVEEHKVDFEGAEYDVRLPIDYFDMSAHAGHADLISFVKHANPEKIYCIHGDTAPEFAEELRNLGFDADAPTPGYSYEIQANSPAK